MMSKANTAVSKSNGAQVLMSMAGESPPKSRKLSVVKTVPKKKAVPVGEVVEMGVNVITKKEGGEKLYYDEDSYSWMKKDGNKLVFHSKASDSELTYIFIQSQRQ